VRDDPVIAVGSEELQLPEQVTAGIDRRQALADGHVWVGRARTEPHVWSDWHHHPGHDTYVYALSGSLAVDFGDDGSERTEVLPGTFVRIAKGVVHREGNPGDVPNEGIVFRIGGGPITVNVDGPA
jgi:uncharacterized RmlC-like cupin family protein